MMRITRIREGQTLIDIAIQETGDIQQLFEVAMMNNVSITDDLVIGAEFISPVPAVNFLAVAASFATSGHKPASGLTAGDLLELQGGIGFMGIQIDFKVS